MARKIWITPFTKNNKARLTFLVSVVAILLCILLTRLGLLMLVSAGEYSQKAQEVQERNRSIKAPRGVIYDRNGVVLAGNQAVCTISVIHNQIKDPETVIKVLSDKLQIDEETIRKKVEKVSSREKIKSNVDIDIGNEIRNLNYNHKSTGESLPMIWSYLYYAVPADAEDGEGVFIGRGGQENVVCGVKDIRIMLIRAKLEKLQEEVGMCMPE